MKNNYQLLQEYLNNDKAVIFGLLIEKKGSAPQVPGASAIFYKQGLLKGTLGGGILEKKAETLVNSLWHQKTNCICNIDYTSEIAEDKGAICGGTASFILDFNPNKSQTILEALNKDLSQQRSGYLITKISTTYEHINIERRWIRENQTSNYDEYAEAINTIKSADCKTSTQLIKTAEQILFIEHLTPPPQLLIIGGGHIGQALCHQGALLGFQVTVVDNRPDYATLNALPEAHSLFVEPDLIQAIRKISLNKSTFIVIVTQGHKTDSEALEYVINSDVAYIGMIGSRRKIQQVKSHFIKHGLSTESGFDKIHAPIGLNIGSKTVQEIAISIAAELILERNKK